MLLQTIDAKWREHLLTLEHLRSVVGFRGYAQRDPLNEYKTEAFQLFQSMLDSLRVGVTQTLSRIRPLTEQEQSEQFAEIRRQMAQQAGAAAPAAPSPDALPAGANPDDPSTWGDVGRNSPCPCGSGKKFKHCHGALV